MKFFKIITYVFLIGFIIDLFGDFFSTEKLKEEASLLGFKGSLTLGIYCLLASINILDIESDLISNIIWFLAIPFSIATIYYMNENNKQESNS
ncbi:MAG TPA: hypothetical protein DDE71_07455 [Tenacibaculum sp.]|nr:hypothetical protein [Tenacibaculum sp.]